MANAALGDWLLTRPLVWCLVSGDHDPADSLEQQRGDVPLLVIHGQRDTIVPISEGRQLFALAAEPKEFWEVSGGQHIDALLYRQAIRERLVERLVAWCE